jgi:hypothetical protein
MTGVLGPNDFLMFSQYFEILWFRSCTVNQLLMQAGWPMHRGFGSQTFFTEVSRIDREMGRRELASCAILDGFAVP